MADRYKVNVRSPGRFVLSRDLSKSAPVTEGDDERSRDELDLPANMASTSGAQISTPEEAGMFPFVLLLSAM